MRWRSLLLFVSSLVACAAPGVPSLTTQHVLRPELHVAAAETTSPHVVDDPPTSEASPPIDPPPPRSPFAFADVDPTNDFVVAPPDERPTCEADLEAAGIKYQSASLPVHVAKKSKLTCGAPQVVGYRGSPEKIAYSPSVTLTCTMALALAHWESIVQEEAMRTFGKRVVKIHHLGTYACREMVGYAGWVSEHSYANAIDIESFVLSDGRTISVLKDFAPKLEIAKTDKGAFLRVVAQRAFDEETFSSVLTPFFNAAHASHFHLDLARFRSDGTRFGGE